MDTAEPLRTGLYIVATPIGNLSDISSRAADVLRRADTVACEDTRVTSKLLSHLGIKKPLVPYHEHNGPKQRPVLLERLLSGYSVALVSDAGTPLISDPGYRLVEDVQESGLSVFAVPGPSAVITALSVAGLPTNRFTFLGFPPSKSKARQDWFRNEEKTTSTLVCYESPRRLKDCLSDMAEVLGNRRVAVCRELTKKFEEVRRDTLMGLIEHYGENGNPKGEVVLVIEGYTVEKVPITAGTAEIDTEKALALALEYMSVKSASKFLSELTGVHKKELYSMALKMKD